MSRKSRGRLKVLGLVVLVGLAVLAGSACGGESPGARAPDGGRADAGTAPPAAKTLRVTLYFGDDQAMYLLPEEREVSLTGATPAEAVLRELIKGPQLPGRHRTIPEGTRLLSVKVADGVAYVDFSREFQSKHWGGTAGEAMTLYSVINSLARLEGIEKVQFLLEGQREESILGHADTGQPLAPNWEMVKPAA